MNIQDVLDELDFYKDQAFSLTEFIDEDSIEINFMEWYSVFFHYNKLRQVIKVEILTRGETYYGETEEHFKYCIEFIKMSAEMIVFNKNKYGINQIQ